ncbi:MAG: hypothetical protein M1833_002121 [Piccolia ochrophora]|nr:MAG: hypothetical protein M1833_002121 [Piccolia ochrophora]
MSNLSSNPSAGEIEDELDYYKVLLDTLEPAGEGDEHLKMVYQKEIKELEHRLGLAYGITALAARSPNNSWAGYQAGHAHYPGSQNSTLQAEEPQDPVWPQSTQAPWDEFGSPPLDDSINLDPYNGGRTTSTTHTSSHPTPTSFSSSMDLQNRKRARGSTGSSTGDFARPEAKSMRTTPSPQLTGPTTPSSFSSLGMSAECVFPSAQDWEIARLFGDEVSGSDPKTIRKSLIEAERLAREQADQEHWDAELARTMQASQNSISPSSVSLQNSLPMRNPSTALGSKQQRPIHSAIGSNRHTATPQNPASSNMGTSARTGTQARRIQSPVLDVPGGFIDIDDFQDNEPSVPQHGGFKLGSSGDQSRSQFGGGRNPVSYGSDTSARSSQADYFNRLRILQQPYESATNYWDNFGGTSGSAYEQPSRNPWAVGAAQGGSELSGGLYPWDMPTAPSGQAASTLTSGSGIFDDLRNQWSRLSNVIPSNLFGLNDNEPPTARQAEYMDYVANDPTKTKEEITALMDNIRADVDIPPENREGTPEAMKYPLMEHQKLGLAWMKNMEEGSNKGGILADDMGLGKTIQALALMVARPSADRRRKTTLIVAPVALLRQWEREISTKLKPDHRLSTYILHGPKRNTRWSVLREYDVVLTTFGTLASEYKVREGWKMKKRANAEISMAQAPSMPLLGEDSSWYRVIIDEAQCIKNRTTKAALGACALRAINRFLLTGTPMMNRVSELHSLIEFLRIKPYSDSKRFQQDFGIPLSRHTFHGYSNGREQAMKRLQALLKAILLRRTKESKIDGKPIISLKPRVVEEVHAVFDDDQQQFYNALETQTQLQFNKYLKQGTVGKHYSNVLVLLLRLRQACCHPHLIQDFSQEVINADVTVDQMMELAKELPPDVVSRLKEAEAFECPVCYDAVENPAIFVPCGHDSCAECFTKICEQSGVQGLAQGNEVSDVKCPTCRAKISLKKFIDYAAFRRVYLSEPTEEETVDDKANVDESESESDNDDSSSDAGSLADFIDDNDEEPDEEYREGRDPFAKALSSKPSRTGPSKRTKSKKDVKGKGKAKPPSKTLAQLKKEGMKSVKARRRYMRRLERNWATSAKVDKCVEIIDTVIANSKDEKTIVFSQFTSLLDLLEVPLSRKGWEFKRYDGSMTSNKRNDAVLEFSDPENRSCRIMLVSLKAGNAGLNLVAASQVIILDPFWNPFVEEQAIDRTHRIGQQREVKVHRILVAGTVEDRIIELQEQKRALIQGALDENASKSIGRLGTKELAYLFGVGAPPGTGN